MVNWPAISRVDFADKNRIKFKLSTFLSSSCFSIFSFSSWYCSVKAVAFPKTSSFVGKSGSICNILISIEEQLFSKYKTFSIEFSSGFWCSKLSCRISSEKNVKSISVFVSPSTMI